MINQIEEVVQRQLCTGCGACAFVEPQRYRMADSLEFGRRPVLIQGATSTTGEAIKVCPGIELRQDRQMSEYPEHNILAKNWGPIFGVWEGYAADPQIRFAGSSGGAASALALFCIEKKGMDGVLHTAARQDVPYLNETVMSKSRGELLARTGSRYSPASPVEGLEQIVQSTNQCVFIGKPCDVAAVSKARKLHKVLDEKIGLTIAFFCAGVPSLKGNLALLKRNGIEDPAKLKSLRFRGNGWPGMWVAHAQDMAGQEIKPELTYQESWGFLQQYRQWRCYICPDHTGEFADVAVGDPWYQKIQPNDPGRSLIVARSKRGFDLIKEAEAAGYITLINDDVALLPASQPNLLATRGALWGRLLTLKMFGAAVPKFVGFSLFQLWVKEVTLKQKIQSITGTVKRVMKKRLRHRIEIKDWV